MYKSPFSTSKPKTAENKLKRKSSDNDESENMSPNSPTPTQTTDSAVKKSKFRLFGRQDSAKIEIPKSKSALPRYNPTKTRGLTVPENRKQQLTEQNSSERTDIRATTPLRVEQTDSNRRISKTPSSLIKTRRSRRSLLRINPGGKIKTFFESSSIPNEDKVNEIIGQKLRSKCKWDLRDKSKRQGEVIVDLRNALKSTYDEFKTIQENCVKAEKSDEDVINDLKVELQDATNALEELKKSENNLKREYIRVSNDYSNASSQLKNIQSEFGPMKKNVITLESKYAELNAMYANEIEKRTLAEASLEGLKRECMELKSKNSEMSDSLTRYYEQRIEQAVAGYRSEVSNLREEVSKRQSDIQKTGDEKEAYVQKISDLKEENFELHATLKESTHLTQRLEMECDKYLFEISELKSKVNTKEEDLRVAFQAINESQRIHAEEKGALRGELSSISPRLRALEDERSIMSNELASKREELQSALREVHHMRECMTSIQHQLVEREAEAMKCRTSLEIEKEIRLRCEAKESDERTERIAACAQLSATQTDCQYKIRFIEEKFENDRVNFENAIQDLQAKHDNAMEQCRHFGDMLSRKESELLEVRKSLEDAEANHKAVTELGRLKGEMEVLRRRVIEANEMKSSDHSSLSRRIQELEEQILAGDIQRRKLHNIVQELRGNVRVFARVRPYLPNDNVDEALVTKPTVAVGQEGASLRIEKTRKNNEERPEEHMFSFDKVFGQSSSQELVFDEVSEFVQSALDGYNVCLFSYGQTGSGKTHTMQGSGDGQMRGIIPRAMQQVGQYKLKLEEKGWSYNMEISFVEIYNETIRDLLRHNCKEELKHEIKKDAQGNLFVSDATMQTVDPNDSVQIDSIMQLAARQRSVGNTAMNAQSSRSHSVFSLHLTATNTITGSCLRGVLNLVDLAGSERLDRSEATGDRLKETVAINKSLSSLTDVFVAISNKQTHIPFRNSKLTQLLQPALSGDGKTLMLVNLSPTEESYYESLCSLRFASQVNQCELGKPKKQIKDMMASVTHTQISSATSASLKPPSALGKTPLSAISASSAATGKTQVASSPSKMRKVGKTAAIKL